MAAIQDVVRARSEADATQRLLEGCIARFHEPDDSTPLGLVVGLAAVAVCERLKAVAVQLDHDQAVTRASE